MKFINKLPRYLEANLVDVTTVISTEENPAIIIDKHMFDMMRALTSGINFDSFKTQAHHIIDIAKDMDSLVHEIDELFYLNKVFNHPNILPTETTTEEVPASPSYQKY